MIIELDSTLKPVSYRYGREKNDIAVRTIPPNKRQRSTYNRETKQNDYFGAGEVNLYSSLPETPSLSHINYSEYLCQAYAKHHKIVITPDIIWHTILSEIAQVVVADPKPYGDLFTTDPDKKTSILVPTDSPENLPMDLLMLGLQALIPNDTSMFFPTLSTTSPLALLAQQAAFAEMCSPYYNYMTFCCGYPAIDVQGTMEDYRTIADSLYKLLALFEKSKAPALLQSYFQKVSRLMVNFIVGLENQDAKFFANILTTESCGSGGEIECLGWWVSNMYVKNYSKQKPENLPTVVSRVPYTNLETNREFTLNCGLFYSVERDDGFYEPQWGWVKNEVVANETAPKKVTVNAGSEE